MADSLQGKFGPGAVPSATRVATAGAFPWYAKTFATMLILLFLVGVAVRWRLDPVAPLGADAPAEVFSATRAANALGMVLGDEQPHPIDSAGASGVRQRIATELAGLGYRVEVQETTTCQTFWFATCARVRNVIAVHEGSVSGKAILLSAHYDSVAAGPGASDAGTAVGTLLEVARLLKTRPTGGNSVIFLFNEGEEAGLLGAEAFITQHPLAKDVAVAINIEARGTSGQSVMFETGDRSGWLVSEFASSSKRPLTNSLLYEAYKLMPNDTDFTVYKARGIQGLNFAHGEQMPYYHTPKDNLDNLDLGSLQQHGDNTFGLLTSLRDADLTAGNAAGNRVYTDILGVGVIHWPVSWAVAIGGVLLAAFAFAAWRLRKFFPFPLGSLVKGLLSFPLALIVSAAVAYALTALLSLVNGGAMPWHSSTLFNRVLLWAAVLLAVISLQKLLARKANPVGLWVGVCVPWLLMAVLSSAALPGTSYLFVLPCIALVIAALLVPLIARRLGDNALSILFATPAVVAFVVLVPAVFLIEVMLGFNAPAGVIGMAMLLALGATFIAPVARPQSSPATKTHEVTSLGLLALVAGGAIGSVLAPSYTRTQPQPLNVSYLQDSAGKAYVLAGNQYRAPPARVRDAMGKAVTLEARLPWMEMSQYGAAIDSIDLPSAGLSMLSDTPTAAGREVTALINAGPSAYKFMLLIPMSAGLVSVKMDGQVVDYSQLPQMSSYNVFVCQGESCDGKRITLVLANKEPQLGLLARVTVGIPGQLEAVGRSRGELAIPFGDGDQSIVVSGVSL
ncbi:MAG: M28 family peptidase [Pseudomonadota bacterium]|nr:M28 family peptidase [Pseudomonadota bacterium]